MAAHDVAAANDTNGSGPGPAHVDQLDRPQGPSPAAEPWHCRLFRGIANNMHYLTFVPLIVISVLQDAHLVLAAILGTSVSAAVLLAGWALHSSGYIKVYPKPFDILNIALYGSMIPLALLEHDWLLMYVGLLTNGTNAAFMWATILLPCSDDFVMHSVRDRVPERIVHHPDLRRMTLLISMTWAVALTIMTGGAIIPVAAKLHPTNPHPVNVVATYVVGFGPLLLAFPVQWWLTKHYKAKMMGQYQRHLMTQQQQQQSRAGCRREWRQAGDKLVRPTTADMV